MGRKTIPGALPLPGEAIEDWRTNPIPIFSDPNPRPALSFEDIAGIPRPFLETVKIRADEVQEGSQGFVPLASALRIAGQGDRPADVWDFVLVGLAAFPPVGRFGKAGHATFRYTMPLTSQGFKVFRASIRVAIRGDLNLAVKIWTYRMGKLGFGPILGPVFRNVVRATPRSAVGSWLWRRYIGGRILMLERMITFAARSVPTHASWIWIRIARQLEAAVAKRALALVGLELDRVLAEAWYFLGPVVMPEYFLARHFWKETSEFRAFWGKAMRETLQEGREAWETFKGEGVPGGDGMGKDRKAAFIAAAKEGRAAGKPGSKAYRDAFRRTYKAAMRSGRRGRSSPRRGVIPILPHTFLWLDLFEDRASGTGDGSDA